MSSTLDSIGLTVNGETLAVPAATTVAGLVERLALDTAKLAIERNREIVPRSRYGAVVLDAGDVLEIVHFIGGG